MGGDRGKRVAFLFGGLTCCAAGYVAMQWSNLLRDRAYSIAERGMVLVSAPVAMGLLGLVLIAAGVNLILFGALSSER